MNPKRLFRTAVVLAFAPLCVSAAPRPTRVALLPAQAGDLAARTALATDATRALLPEVSREAVSFTQALRADQPLSAEPETWSAQSREYFVEVSADALRAGTPIFTTRPNALVRLNAAAAELLSGRGRELSLDPARLVLRQGKAEYGDGSGMSLLVNADQLAASGAPFAPGTAAFRIKPELGAGRFEIVAPDVRDDGRYVIHVFEPQSDVVLALHTGRGDYLHGETLTVEAALASAAIERFQAFVSSPGGRTWPLTFARDGAGLRASLPLDALAAPGQGLWEVHVRAEGRQGDAHVVRTARTAFACSLPTAVLGGDAAVTSGRDGVAVALGVDVATAGRYDVSGVLYGTDAKGQLRPLALAHAANWLEPGRASLTLTFDAARVEAARLTAPFELRDLRLVDQGRMGVLHRQSRAFVLP